ncbi:MAG: metallopeptidase TldD-related protein [Candidatus Bipolaricaulota bacterium]|nr:metallopeptidase TldD-related protein [Candidatus Bipolaricaulota bacterium]
MQDAMDRARGVVDSAELYWTRERTLSVGYGDGQLQSIVDNDLSSVALRVIDKGHLGSTFGLRPDEPSLVEQAVRAASYGDKATFSFAGAAEAPRVDHYDEEVARFTAEDLVRLCDAVRDAVRRVRPDVALHVHASATTTRRTVRTTLGADMDDRSTSLVLAFGAPIRGVGVSVNRSLGAVGSFATPLDLVDEFDTWYAWTEKVSTPRTGRIPVIFAPEASFLYLLPLSAGLAGNAIEKKTSPITERMGETILSPRLTLRDDALRAGDPASRPFDDEGVPCQRRTLVESGVLRGLLLDLRSAAALGLASTGNGIKRELFTAGTEIQPNPWAVNWIVEPGDSSLEAMIAELDEGLLVTGGIGFHSGNYSQGAFSVQAVGFHVRSGRVIGRLDRTMLSGNIYTDLLRIRSLSREARRSYTSMLSAGGGCAPYVLVDSLQVAGL